MAQLQKQNRQKCTMFPQKQKHIKFHIPDQFLFVPLTEVLHFPLHSKETEKGYFFDELIEKNAEWIVSSNCVIVKEATKIPLAIFTKLFHHCFLRKSLIWNQRWNYCSSSTSNLWITPIHTAFLLVISTNIVCIVPDVIVL
jgi:hypothetical protein